VAAPAKEPKGVTRRKGARTDPGPKGKVAAKQGADKGRAGKEAKRGKKSSRQELARQVSQELAKLRPILKDVGAALMDRLDGGLAGLVLSLGGEALHGERPVLPRPPVLSAMLADIKALEIKPKKGRVKDLGRIHVLLESLNERIPPGP
jgi:hypothetical protein